MKETTLGILGLGSQTTAFYLKELNRVFNEIKGGYSTCPFVLLNTNFDTINSLLPNVSEELNEIVQASISEIENSEIEYILIPNITLHETIDRLKLNTSILHPLDICLTKLKENNWNKVTLFGSIHTMKSHYIRNNFAKNNIEIILPSEEDMQFIDQVRKDVYAEKQTNELIKKYHSTIEKYTENYPVILACTELSIFKPNKKDVLDMVELQIKEAVKTVLKHTIKYKNIQ
ncbi:aspartate/glutamate racemase family protein [Wenyingzhuangia sp. 2_MG-2023]|uniref:aspartate/glutamate racemase family protein n=1 Tax=Wenyingzhuangia sp. 2_MG-2023 TaxID=3062639 RepID=UPI0026E42025|nr:aspartate/glutamate racemase family protein [Wenyingzhuangia sp. 2_MG-2023]MDO6737336.1 aspartate/glutamate racemase family protein [Wenyingzhuangia sp. 2_MG-2023]